MTFTCKERRNDRKEALNELFRKLVSEDIDELNAGCFEERQVVHVLFLQLRDHPVLDVLPELILRDSELVDSKSERVNAHSSTYQQVEHAGFISPLSCSVSLILSLHLFKALINELCNFRTESLTQSLQKPHAMFSSRFNIRIFKIVFYIRFRIVLKLFHIFLSYRNIWHNQHRK